MMRILIGFMLILCSIQALAQMTPKTLPAKRTSLPIKIDGKLDDAAWKDAPAALDYIEFRPTPFKKEDPALRTEVYMLYSDEGIYISGYCHERTKDSIAAELNGRDGFGSNDYVGVIFDTYNDKINGFEYFVTPYGEQWDAKMSPVRDQNGNNEDFTWNAVWKSAALIHHDGWSFEMFIPFSAIRFSKKNIQDWGLNITRRRQKTQQQVTWNPIDVNINGFLTQEGFWTGLENIQPPIRLQLFPYLSFYVNHYPFHQNGVKDWTSSVNGGMDLKYGISQAITLDMTLIPDFGQVQSDNQILNLTPFEVKFNENRPFFTEGTELFNKGNFFYSRRVGGQPLHFDDVKSLMASDEHLLKNPTETKLLNATKISGRLKSGLGIGFFNAIAREQFATVENTAGVKRKIQTSPLTNYNIVVLDQSLKHNSSVSFVNTSVLRSGKDYDANVTAGLFDLYDKSNTWNLSGKVAISNLMNKAPSDKTVSGYGHSINFGKSSGRFNFNVQQELANDRLELNDLGYFTNNNYLNYSLYAGYHWTKPSTWYNNLYLNFNTLYTRRFKPNTYQNANINANINGQLKNLWYAGSVWGYEPVPNNFYEAHVPGRVFRGWWDWFTVNWVQTDFNKKYGVMFQVMYVSRSMFHSKRHEYTLQQNFRFGPKFSIGYNLDLAPQTNNVGFATIRTNGDIIFGRRDIQTAENIFNVKYTIKSKMVFTARIRHYWSKVNYKELFKLQEDGSLLHTDAIPEDTVHQNYNSFTVDAGISWEFAPGSFINLVWKNNTPEFLMNPFDKPFTDNYFQNFNHTMTTPQNNNLSIKVIYFLDYLQMKNWKKKKQEAK